MDNRLEFNGRLRIGLGALVAILATTLSGPTLALEPSNVLAWGWNDEGELGDGTAIPRDRPVRVVGPFGQSEYLGEATAVAGGGQHGLALMPNGTVYTWGFNQNGQLGNGGTTNSLVPVVVAGSTGALTGVSAVSGSVSHSLALKSDHTVWAWGAGFYGALGNGSILDRTTPVQVVGPGGVGFLTGVIAIAAGEGDSLALKSDGTVWVWGHQLAGAYYAVPQQKAGRRGTGFLTGVTAIAGDGGVRIALKSDGTVWTWGNNSYGQLGQGTVSDGSLEPAQVLGPKGVGFLTGVVAIAANNSHVLALKTDGTVWVWGLNQQGQLGIGTQGGSVSVPVQVLGPERSGFLTGVTAVSAGAFHSLARKSDGTLWAWGESTIEMDAPNLVPVRVRGLDSVVSTAAGYMHSIAVGRLVPITTLSIIPSTIALGGSARLDWSSTNSTSCTASGAWTGFRPTSSFEIVSPANSGTYTYTLSCTGSNGASDSMSTRLTVLAPPTVVIGVNPTTISTGQSSTLSWSSSAATSCTAGDAWSGSKATSGSQNVSPAVGSHTYTLSCTGAGGSTTRSATLIVKPAPTLVISVDPTIIHRFTNPKTATLTWSSTNVSSCTASGSWTGVKPTSGSLLITNTVLLQKTETYTLTCSGPGGTVSGSAKLVKKVF